MILVFVLMLQIIAPFICVCLSVYNTNETTVKNVLLRNILFYSYALTHIHIHSVVMFKWVKKAIKITFSNSYRLFIN